MLTAIRTAASNWLGRAVLVVIMSFLIVSFAIWGIGDIFRGRIATNVATVGSANIDSAQFRSSFTEEMRRLQARVRRPITLDEARAFGLDRAVLDRLIDEQALNSKAKALGLALDETQIAKSIIDAPVFRANGAFSRERFAELLAQSGLSEAAFVRAQGDALLRQQLLVGLAGVFTAPSALGLADHQYRNEERNLDALVIPAEKAPEPAAPDEAALRAFHTERKSEFRTEETRKVTLLATSSAAFAAGISLDENDLRAFYDRALAAGRFGTPERRRAMRVLFDDEAQAKAAAERLAGGLDFAALLAERKLSEADVDLGLRTRNQVTDPAVREAVFALKPGETSAPIKDAFGSVLIRLVAVEPARAAPFETVRSQIESEARLDKVARDPGIAARLSEIFQKVEDQRLAGKSLAEAARAAELAPLVIPALDRRGEDGAGQRVALPGTGDTLGAIFASDIGLDNEPMQQRDGGHVWFEVNGVEPARDKAFEEVREEVARRYLADQRARALAELATGLVKRIEEGTTLAAIAGELGLAVQPFSAIRRTSREPILGAAGVERAFAGRIGKPVSALAPDGVGRLLLIPTGVSLLPYDPAEDVKSGYAARLSQSVAEDLLQQYTVAVRKELGVTINQQVLNQALGTAQN